MKALAAPDDAAAEEARGVDEKEKQVAEGKQPVGLALEEKAVLDRKTENEPRRQREEKQKKTRSTPAAR